MEKGREVPKSAAVRSQPSLDITAGDAVGTASPRDKVPKGEGDWLSGEAGPCS